MAMVSCGSTAPKTEETKGEAAVTKTEQCDTTAKCATACGSAEMAADSTAKHCHGKEGKGCGEHKAEGKCCGEHKAEGKACEGKKADGGCCKDQAK